MRPGKPKFDLTDEQLMKLYQNGDEEAFKALYERHSAKIFGFLKSRVSSKEKVPEIYQEVFVKIHKSKSLYNDSFPALAWIFTVTKSVLIDELRKDKRILVTDNYDLENLTNTAEQDHSEDTSDLLDQLPSHQKAAVEMRYISDRTFEEIAESLKISPSNARKVISRGIKRLRQIVEGDKS